MLTLKDGGLNHFGAAVALAKEINGDRDFISHTWSIGPAGIGNHFLGSDKLLSAENFLSNLYIHFSQPLFHTWMGALISTTSNTGFWHLRNNFAISYLAFGKMPKLQHHFSTSQFSSRQRARNVEGLVAMAQL